MARTAARFLAPAACVQYARALTVGKARATDNEEAFENEGIVDLDGVTALVLCVCAVNDSSICVNISMHPSLQAVYR